MSLKKSTVAQSLNLESIKGNRLDKFLAKGWYRMGASIFTSHYIHYEKDLFSTIWLRNILNDYQPSKSLRKIFRKNNERFSYVIEPYSYTEELENLYQRYRTTFKGNIPESLSEYMMGSLESEVFDTRIVKVYDQDKLAAASIFDSGADSIASIFGFYDPEYGPLSLGLYTMLLEIEFCKANDLAIYYVGYFVPGNSRFDYKLRLGCQEYLDFKSDTWISIDEFKAEQTPLAVTTKKLSFLQEKLGTKINSKISKNAFVDAFIIEFFYMKYVEAPLILILENKALEDNQQVICTFDIRQNKYQLLLCHLLPRSFSNYNPDWLDKMDDQNCTDQYVVIKNLKSCKTPLPILRWVEGQK